MKPPPSCSPEHSEAIAESWRKLDYVYRPMVRYWCRCLRPHWRAEDIEDVVQEVFRTVAQKIRDFRREHVGGFRGWLWQITQNHLLNRGKRMQKEPQGIGGSDAQKITENAPEPADFDSSVVEAATERTILVRRAMELVRSEVEPPTWEAAWRVLVEDQSPRDVAADLRMSVGAVYTATSRVKSRLRQVLDDLVDGDALDSSQ